MADSHSTGPLAELELSVPDKMCDGCAEKIGSALRAIPGVQAVKAKLWRKRVRVRYDSSRLHSAQIREALRAAGFSAIEGDLRGSPRNSK
jgi:Cu+-exporting ATPase